MTVWQRVLDRVVGRPAVIPSEIPELRSALVAVGDIGREDVDASLAAGWRAAEPVVRQQVLRDALDGLAPGPAVIAALLASAESSNHVSANAALHVLGSVQPPLLTGTHWQRIARLAASQRGALLPDVEAAVLLCEYGPQEAFATVALCAFREGPEDAEDRQVALCGLGRFDRPEVLPWLEELAAAGVLGVECIGALAQWAMRSGTAVQGAERSQFVRTLHAAAGHAPRHENHLVDAWQRWAAIDVLCRVVGEEAAPLAVAAWLAGGDDLEPWFMAGVAQRVCDVCPATGPAREGVEAVTAWFQAGGAPALELPPIAPIAMRAGARSPRISRRAMVLLEQSDIEPAAFAAIAASRAAVEQSLVARQQLMASFLVDQHTQGVELGAEWRPTHEILSQAQRQQLEAEERAWLGPLSG
jgi:hypothetical protein